MRRWLPFLVLITVLIVAVSNEGVTRAEGAPSRGTLAQIGKGWSKPTPAWAFVRPKVCDPSCDWPEYKVDLPAKYSQNDPLWHDVYMESLHEQIGHYQNLRTYLRDRHRNVAEMILFDSK